MMILVRDLNIYDITKYNIKYEMHRINPIYLIE